MKIIATGLFCSFLLLCLQFQELNAQSKSPIGFSLQSPFNKKTGKVTANVIRSQDKPNAKEDGELEVYTFEKSNDSYWFEFSERSLVTNSNFFNECSAELKMTESENFRLYRTENDDLDFTHYRYQQYYLGIPVIGGEFLLHEKNNLIKKANGKVYSGLDIEISPTISEQTAIDYAINAIAGTQHQYEAPELVIAPKNGIYADENFKLCYKVKVTSQNPYQIFDVFVDAHSGHVINKVSGIAEGDVVGTANTMYSGTQSMTADFTGSNYRLQEVGRPIQTYNMQNGTDFGNAIDFTDTDNNWTEQSFMVESVTINNIAQGWWYTLIADQIPDLYLIIKDGSNNIVMQTGNANDMQPPLIFTLKLLLDNPPYIMEVWDFDAVGADDFGGSYSLNLSVGSNAFTGNGNSGTYTIGGQNNPALDVHWGMEETYDYFLNEHGRNSFDGLGTTIEAYVHNDVGFNNAFWNGQAMVFGDGDGTTMTYLVSLDVAGHEFTHAVVEKTAGLVYQGESGALNESFSDIFGTAIEFYSNSGTANWTIGEDIMLTEPYMRSMSDPNSQNQPDTYGSGSVSWADPSNIAYDHGGVHINSGIQNAWFYLLSQGGSGTNDKGNAYSVTGIGIDQAKQIAYRNLTVYLSTNSQYMDAMNGAISAAEDLYGNGSSQYWAVQDAWYAVGLGSSSGGVFCGETATFTESSGSFTDGSGSANYLDNSDCKWLIQPTGANNITLNFSLFDTETGYDSVIVYDGPDTTFPVLMIWWGNTLPPAVASTGGAMLVRFMSDGSMTAAGWAANYSSTGTIYCNGLTILSTGTGSFTDGSGGNSYSNNSQCVWYIAPPGATSVTLSFSAFNTEMNYDGLVVYDDIDGTNLLGTFTGSTIPSSITSTTGEMLVGFVSDFSTSASGFSASYTSTGTPFCSGSTTLTSDFDLLDDGSGINDYYNNSDCGWLIQPSGALSITLIFTSFDLEEPSFDGNTIYDYVEVYDGPNTSASLLGTYTGANLPPSMTSSGGSMYIRFISDFAVTAGGWDAYYLTNTTTYCNTTTTLVTSSGSITDGSGAGNYGNNSDCKWLIQPPGANSITLSFSAFSTELDYDGIVIFDGADTSAAQLGILTGSSIPSPVVSTGGAMLVWFLSDDTEGAAGFNATYSSSSSTGLNEIGVLGPVVIYPNPSTGKFLLNINAYQSETVNIQVFDITGRIVFVKDLRTIKGENLMEIDLSEMAAGFYSLQVNGKNQVVNKKLVLDK